MGVIFRNGVNYTRRNYESVPNLVPWSTGTDEEITAMVNAYYSGIITLEDIKSVWNLGDKRSVEISAMDAVYVGESHRAQTVEFEILDFDHDNLTTPRNNITKALISIDTKDCLRDAEVTDTTGYYNTENGYMNSTDTSIGSWRNCARRKWCNKIFYNSLPKYFKRMVKKVDKLTMGGNGSNKLLTDSDYCFILSETEVVGYLGPSHPNEGSRYTWLKYVGNYYKLPKWNNSSSTKSCDYWMRSPGSSERFSHISYSGNMGNLPASNKLGIYVACCI